MKNIAAVLILCFMTNIVGITPAVAATPTSNQQTQPDAPAVTTTQAQQTYTYQQQMITAKNSMTTGSPTSSMPTSYSPTTYNPTSPQTYTLPGAGITAQDYFMEGFSDATTTYTVRGVSINSGGYIEIKSYANGTTYPKTGYKLNLSNGSVTKTVDQSGTVSFSQTYLTDNREYYDIMNEMVSVSALANTKAATLTDQTKANVAEANKKVRIAAGADADPGVFFSVASTVDGQYYGLQVSQLYTSTVGYVQLITVAPGSALTERYNFTAGTGALNYTKDGQGTITYTKGSSAYINAVMLIYKAMQAIYYVPKSPTQWLGYANTHIEMERVSGVKGVFLQNPSDVSLKEKTVGAYKYTYYVATDPISKKKIVSVTQNVLPPAGNYVFKSFRYVAGDAKHEIYAIGPVSPFSQTLTVGMADYDDALKAMLSLVQTCVTNGTVSALDAKEGSAAITQTFMKSLRDKVTYPPVATVWSTVPTYGGKYAVTTLAQKPGENIHTWTVELWEKIWSTTQRRYIATCHAKYAIDLNTGKITDIRSGASFDFAITTGGLWKTKLSSMETIFKAYTYNGSTSSITNLLAALKAKAV